MFKIDLNDKTKRRFFLVNPKRSGHNLEFKEYEVSGFS